MSVPTLCTVKGVHSVSIIARDSGIPTSLRDFLREYCGVSEKCGERFLSSSTVTFSFKRHRALYGEALPYKPQLVIHNAQSWLHAFEPGYVVCINI